MAPVKGCCDFCERPRNDVLYGPIHRLKGIKCHYYCLLFSSNLDQNGKDDEGILGFLYPDIKKELRRAKTVNCSYCRKPGGVSNCHANKCKKKFHLPCGLERGSLHLFYDDFRSYCGEHRRKQNVPDDILNSKDVTCSICFEPVEDLTSNDSIWAPCCKKNGWFHRLCIQKFALNAAYFFKCPLCASQDKFRTAMLRNGIYIPDQDASWELEPNAFEELLHRHEQCDAATCKCPEGRTFTSEGSRFWNLILCRNCASRGIHVGCIPGPKSSLDRRSAWDCSVCNTVIRGKMKSLDQETAVTIKSSAEEEEVEVVALDEDECDNNTCDKVGDVEIRNPDIQQILSNVIHLKSTTIDFIDLVNDENDGVEVEKINDDDEGLLELNGSMKEEASFNELVEDRRMEFRNEVGQENLLDSTNPTTTDAREEFCLRRRSILSSRGTNTSCSRKLRRSRSFTSISDSISICNSKCSSRNVRSSHYIGLRSTNGKICHYSGNGSNCLKCLRTIEARAGKLYGSLLVDGWCEILGRPSMSSIDNNRFFCKDMYKMHWVRKARWACGLMSFLSDLRQSCYDNDYLNDSSYMLCEDIDGGDVCEYNKMKPDRYLNSYPKVTVEFLN